MTHGIPEVESNVGQKLYMPDLGVARVADATPSSLSCVSSHEHSLGRTWAELRVGWMFEICYLDTATAKCVID
jgi:hypothetical protein